MNFKAVNEEVIYSCEPVIKIMSEDIKLLKEMASRNKRRRIRLCTHRDIKEKVHEMLIVHPEKAYVQPHKHLKKSESFHLIEGNLLVVIFDSKGTILETIRMGDYQSKHVFYYRLQGELFHMVIPLSNFVVFHEVTSGPFQREDTVLAPWAPKDDEFEAQSTYLNKLYYQLGLKEE